MEQRRSYAVPGADRTGERGVDAPKNTLSAPSDTQRMANAGLAHAMCQSLLPGHQAVLNAGEALKFVRNVHAEHAAASRT